MEFGYLSMREKNILFDFSFFNKLWSATPSELIVADSVKKDTVITAVSDSLPARVSSEPEPAVIFNTTIRVENNIILAGLANLSFF